MGKVIFGLLIAAMVWLLFFAKRKKNKQTLNDKNAKSSTATAQIEQIVKCVRCGVNIPQGEATKVTDNTFVCANPAQCQPPASRANSP